jgi:hypothetical protein
MVSHRVFRLVTLTIIAAFVVALAPTFHHAQAAGGVMAYGDVVSGQIDNATYYELWQFSGKKGDRITITMTGDGQLDPYVGLIEMASEQVLAEDDDSAGNSNAMIETTLPSTGDFAIVATRYDFDQGTSQGSYSLELRGGTGPQNNSPTTNVGQPQEIQPGVYYMGDITMATPVSGDITNDSYAQLYSLQLDAGTDLVIGMFADNSRLDAYLMFGTEDGTVLAEDDDSGASNTSGTDALIQLTVPSAGNYLIVATRSGVDQGKSTGAYGLIVGTPEDFGATPTNNPDNTDLPPGMEYGGDVALGNTVSGAISNSTYVQLYTFDGNAGDMVTITAQGNLDAYLGLIDPNSDVIAEDDDSAGGAKGLDAQISIRLPESGVYTVVATRSGIDQGETTGNYTLTLTSGTPQAPAGASGLGGFGGLPGRAFAAGSKTFYLRGNGRTIDPAKLSPLQLYLNPELPGRENK